jgi:hypothetical protein
MNVVEPSLILMYEIRKKCSNLKKRDERWSKAFYRKGKVKSESGVNFLDISLFVTS